MITLGTKLALKEMFDLDDDVLYTNPENMMFPKNIEDIRMYFDNSGYLVVVIGLTDGSDVEIKKDGVQDAYEYYKTSGDIATFIDAINFALKDEANKYDIVNKTLGDLIISAVDNLNISVSESKVVKENIITESYAEKEDKIVSDLADEFGQEYKEEIELSIEKKPYGRGYWEFEYEGSTYGLYESYDDAHDAAAESLKESLDDNVFDIKNFSGYIDYGRADKYFEDLFEQDINSAFDDFILESSTNFASRAHEELYDAGLITYFEASDEGLDVELYRNEYVKIRMEDIARDGFTDRFIDDFGEEHAFGILMEKNFFDYDQWIEDTISNGGIGDIINSYDGSYEETKSGMIYFRID